MRSARFLGPGSSNGLKQADFRKLDEFFCAQVGMNFCPPKHGLYKKEIDFQVGKNSLQENCFDGCQHTITSANAIVDMRFENRTSWYPVPDREFKFQLSVTLVIR